MGKSKGISKGQLMQMFNSGYYSFYQIALHFNHVLAAKTIEHICYKLVRRKKNIYKHFKVRFEKCLA